MNFQVSSAEIEMRDFRISLTRLRQEEIDRWTLGVAKYQLSELRRECLKKKLEVRVKLRYEAVLDLMKPKSQRGLLKESGSRQEVREHSESSVPRKRRMTVTNQNGVEKKAKNEAESWDDQEDETPAKKSMTPATDPANNPAPESSDDSSDDSEDEVGKISCQGDGLGVKGLRWNYIPAGSNYFTIDTSRADGTGTGNLLVGVKWKDGFLQPQYVTVTPVTQHIYRVHYFIKERRNYKIFVKWGGQHVPGSPFPVRCK